MDQNQNISLFGIQVDGSLSATLRNAASWARILAICGFILGGLCIILGIVVQSSISSMRSEFGGTEYERGQAGMVGMMGMLVYVLLGVLYIISSVFAIMFATKTSAGLNTNDATALNAGFSGMRNYFAFWAILLIILIMLMLIGLLGVLLGNR